MFSKRMEIPLTQPSSPNHIFWVIFLHASAFLCDCVWFYFSFWLDFRHLDYLLPPYATPMLFFWLLSMELFLTLIHEIRANLLPFMLHAMAYSSSRLLNCWSTIHNSRIIIYIHTHTHTYKQAVLFFRLLFSLSLSLFRPLYIIITLTMIFFFRVLLGKKFHVIDDSELRYIMWQKKFILITLDSVLHAGRATEFIFAHSKCSSIENEQLAPVIH